MQVSSCFTLRPSFLSSPMEPIPSNLAIALDLIKRPYSRVFLANLRGTEVKLDTRIHADKISLSSLATMMKVRRLITYLCFFKLTFFPARFCTEHLLS